MGAGWQPSSFAILDAPLSRAYSRGCRGLALPLASPAHAQSVADFYKGKSVALAISFAPGGGYDLYARILGRHMGKHIPGNPNDRAAEHARRRRTCASRSIFYNAAPKDGSMFGTFTRMAHIAPLYDPGQKYDSAKFTWLGAITDAVSVCITWHTSPVKTWEDFLTKPTTFGGTGPERRGRHLHQCLQERVRRQRQARRRLFRHRRRPCSRSSAARSTACAASTGPR